VRVTSVKVGARGVHSGGFLDQTLSEGIWHRFGLPTGIKKERTKSSRYGCPADVRIDTWRRRPGRLDSQQINLLWGLETGRGNDTRESNIKMPPVALAVESVGHDGIGDVLSNEESAYGYHSSFGKGDQRSMAKAGAAADV